MSRSFSLADLFEIVVDTVPDNSAISSPKRRLKYRELEERANRLANYWRGKGVKAGDHIGLQLRNGSEYIEGMLAAYKLRAVPVNINYNYVEGELRYLFDNADLVALVVHQQYAPRVANIIGELPKLHIVDVVPDASGADVADNFGDYESALASASPERDFPARSGDDLYIIYTGGTTGMPKGVMWRQEDIFFASMGGGDPDRSKGPIESPEQLAERLTATPEFEMGSLPAPPFMHAAAQWMAFNTLLSGAKLVITEGFDPAAIWRAISDENVVAVAVVGDAMAIPLADELEKNRDQYSPDFLFVIASGGALFSPSVKARLLKMLPNTMVLDGLGSSETGLMGDKSDAGGEAGKEPKFKVNEFMVVLDDNDKPLPWGSGKMGRLAKRGRVPLGYYKAPEKSAETFVELDGERWAIPGDLATVEEDGSIILHGRGSTSINTGGEKVFPEEVESALKAHGEILDAVVVGVPDERWGQKIVALYKTRSGKPIDTEALQNHCRGHIAGYKLPREMLLLDFIKRSPAGKADYPWAKAEAMQLLGLQA